MAAHVTGVKGMDLLTKVYRTQENKLEKVRKYAHFDAQPEMTRNNLNRLLTLDCADAPLFALELATNDGGGGSTESVGRLPRRSLS